MSVSMPFAENFQLFAFLEILALPATIDALIPAANPDLAVRGASTLSASSLAANFYQSAQYFIAGRIASKDIEERNLGESFCRFFESGSSKLFSKVPGQICYLACMQEAVIAVYAAESNALQVIIYGLHKASLID
jgi:hypothetical protein